MEGGSSLRGAGRGEGSCDPECWGRGLEVPGLGGSVYWDHWDPLPGSSAARRWDSSPTQGCPPSWALPGGAQRQGRSPPPPTAPVLLPGVGGCLQPRGVGEAVVMRAPGRCALLGSGAQSAGWGCRRRAGPWEQSLPQALGVCTHGLHCWLLRAMAPRPGWAGGLRGPPDLALPWSTCRDPLHALPLCQQHRRPSAPSSSLLAARSSQSLTPSSPFTPRSSRLPGTALEASRCWGRQPHLPARHTSPPTTPGHGHCHRRPGWSQVGPQWDRVRSPGARWVWAGHRALGRPSASAPTLGSPGSHPGQAPGSRTQVRLQTPVGPGVGGTQRVWGAGEDALAPAPPVDRLEEGAPAQEHRVPIP